MKQGLEERFKKPKGWLWGHFNNARGAALRFGRLSAHKTPVAHIIYIEGLSEYAEKTFELARDFNKMACNFSVIDRHGQGRSPRYLNNREKQHSQGVEHDIDDIIRYCKDYIPEGEPIILLGHSTGGLIAMMALEKAPELFKGAVLTAPLFGIQNNVVRGREHIFAKTPTITPLYNKYIPGSGDWLPRYAPESALSQGDFTSDPVRKKIHDHWKTNDKVLRTGAPTFGWVIQMCKAIVKTKDPSFAQNLQRPVLIFTAENDVLIENKNTFNLAARLKNAEHHHYQDGKHELLMEKDEIRNDIMSKIRNFLKFKL